MSFPGLFLPASVRALCAAALFALATGPASAAAPFVDNGDGTVTDTSTGLMWDQCTWGQTYASGGCTGGGTPQTWTEAQYLGGPLNEGGKHRGYADWRLPGGMELLSLVKAGATNPAIDTAAFPATILSPNSLYWTSAARVNSGGQMALVVWFDSGSSGVYSQTNPLNVRLVRSGQCLYPFSMLPVTMTAVGTTTAAFTATSGFAATGHWVVVARNAQAPLPAQIKAGTNYAGVAVVAKGSVAMGAGSPASVAVTGLAPGSQYDIYLWPEKAGYIPGCAAMQPFATTAISTSSIVIDPATPATLYSGLDGSGVYKSTDSGANWTAAATQPANTRVKALAIKPGDGSKLYTATYGGGVFKSSDSGANWSACATQPANLNLLSLTMDAAGKLYAGSEAGVFVSSDGCANWTAMNSGLPN